MFVCVYVYIYIQKFHFQINIEDAYMYIFIIIHFEQKYNYITFSLYSLQTLPVPHPPVPPLISAWYPLVVFCVGFHLL